MALTKVIGAGLGSVSSADLDGAVTINESSADKDFRVESNGNANMLVVDGGDDIIAIGKSGSHTVGGFKNTLQVEGTGATSSSISVTRNANDDNPPYLQFGKSRGTSVGSNTIVQNGDEVGTIAWNAADGTNRDTPAASIRVSVDGTPGENDMPGRIEFFTTADGAATSTERVRIHNGGVASFNNGIALGVGTANTASNVLDDYEEGTWTPAVSSGTISTSNYTNSNSYVKVGKLVVAYCRFHTISDTSGGTAFDITNLPFAISSAGSYQANIGEAWGNEMGDHRSFFLYGTANSTTANGYYGAAGNAGYNQVLHSDLGGNTNVIAKITYKSV